MVWSWVRAAHLSCDGRTNASSADDRHIIIAIRLGSRVACARAWARNLLSGLVRTSGNVELLCALLEGPGDVSSSVRHLLHGPVLQVFARLGPAVVDKDQVVSQALSACIADYDPATDRCLIAQQPGQTGYVMGFQAHC